MEELRTEILSEMMGVISDSEIEILERVLDRVLYNYNISKKSRELSVLDNSNEIILKNFLGVKALEGCSKTTLNHYRDTIRRMLDDIGKNVNEITTNDLRHHFATWQVTRDVSNTTLNNMRRTYSTFFKWCAIENIIQDNPILRINAFKATKKQIKPFTETEMEEMVDNCKSIRDKALINFLYSTGCRVSECSSVNVEDIDFRAGTVIIRHGKGNKERITYISEKCMYWVKKYLNTRKDNDSCLWYGRKGRLSKNGIEAVIKKIGNKSNIKAHPHKFRHTLASDMIKKNAPIQIVQKILGHEDINTTMIYVTINNNEVENVYRKLVA